MYIYTCHIYALYCLHPPRIHAAASAEMFDVYIDGYVCTYIHVSASAGVSV